VKVTIDFKNGAQRIYKADHVQTEASQWKLENLDGSTRLIPFDNAFCAFLEPDTYNDQTPRR
jgi:hypothetical protein